MSASEINSHSVPLAPDFDFVRCIGEGGFGRVWLAVNRTTGQRRAVKVVPRIRFGDRDPAGREVAAISRLESILRLSHPNLLTIHHVGQTADHLFYVMDLADDMSGRSDTINDDYCPATLENRLKAGPLESSECRRYAAQLLSALACLHEAGMVHRDVKPANCLFIGGELKLGDFGLLTHDNSDISRVGTLRYMPPDGRMDALADVHAAGLLIYEMLSGLPTESFPALGARAREVLDDPLLSLLNRIALKACDPDRARRYRNAREMHNDLTTYAIHTDKISRGRRALLCAGMASIAAAIIFMAWPAPPVNVNFVTEPYEAVIYLDGRLLCAPDGVPYRTPCTVFDLSPRPHQVTFRWNRDLNDSSSFTSGGKLDAGEINFADNRQITAKQQIK